MELHDMSPRGRGADFLVLALVLLAPSCASSGGEGTTSNGKSNWNGGPISEAISLDADYAVQVAYESDVRVNGVAAGELDPKRPGDEIVAVDHLGRIQLITRKGDSFVHETIASTGGELVQVAVGDLLASAPGRPPMDEIVAVGVHSGTEDDPGPGVIRVFHREAGGHWAETSYLTEGLVHAVAVGPLGLGGADQFVCAGFFPQAFVGMLTTKVEGGGVALEIGAIDLPPIGNVKGVALMDEGFVLAADDGHSVEYMVLPGEFGHRPPVQHGSPLARVAYSREVGVLLADNDGYLRVMSTGPSPTSSILEHAKQRLRGAVLLDIDPSHPGLEACSAGYDGRVRVVDLTRASGDAVGWEGAVHYVARDSGKLHHLTSGNIAGVGSCLISCGYSGDVLLIHRQDG